MPAITESTQHFAALAAVWSQLQLPLRPREPVPTRLRAVLPKGVKDVLVLGVTPDYADIAPDVTALDWSEGMIAHVWPGDTETRRAVQGDWRDMPFEDAQFDAVVGDNSLAFLPFPDQIGRAFAQVRRVLRPEGLAVFRMFLAPDQQPGDADLVRFGRALKGRSSDALRWRVAMQAACEAATPNVIADDGWRVFQRAFPDMASLVEGNEWGADEVRRLALFDGSTMALSFPTRAELARVALQHFATLELLSSGSYLMAEDAPFVVMRGSAAG